MSTDAFADREKGFEAKFKLDQEQEFRAQARRNRLFGLWAAAKLGKAGPDAEAYAKTIVAADFQKPGHDDVLEKVAADLAAGGHTLTMAELRTEYDAALAAARRQVASESAPG
jgi:hypothetical protein